MILKRISGPASELVTVADVKLHTHIDYDVEDTLIENWIKAARIAAEDYQGRAYYTQVYDLYFDSFPCSVFEIPRPPLVSVDSLKYYDTANTEYDFDLNDLIIDTSSEPGRISLGYSVQWPTVTLRPINGVKIRFTAGYGDAGGTTTTPDFVITAVPSSVKDVIYVYCAWRNENRAGETDLPRQFYDILRPDRIVQC
jgi:uncharacterized phiE125 gp8 family phage protein